MVRHRALGAVDYWGDPPSDHVTFIVPLQIDGYRVNLESPLSEEVVLLPPASEIAITTHGHDQFIVYMPLGLFKRHLGNDDSIGCRSLDRVRRLRINQYRRQQLIRLLTESGHKGGRVANPLSAEHQIREIFADLLCTQDIDAGDALRGETRMKAIRRARDFIMAHMDTHMMMHDISNAAGVSERTLQRLFKDEFQLAPVQYIKAQRLEAVRRALILGRSNVLVYFKTSR